ncbi:MAG: hypothetical protein NW224_20815 [Leptolyngbyaceae cyanobacterium bins.302]|nr:hypothetical protein [Leptolyngbyaceae cyanobacterium bins.302]
MNHSNEWAIVLCPGFHAATLTQAFLAQLATIVPSRAKVLVFPSDRRPVYSIPDILYFLYERLNAEWHRPWLKVPVVFVGFSAGVVGAMGAALAWEMIGGNVLGLFALDGLGVPVVGSFPTHRLSSNHFTHWSSAWFGGGQDSFYADPEIEHLTLWKSPQTVQGWWVSARSSTRTTLLQFLAHWLNDYQP